MKNKFFAVFLFLSLFLAASRAFAEEDLFKEANVSYQVGDYKKAISLYKKIITSKKATANVYYNLGNASFRDGNRGEALAAYERAHALDPRDRDVEWNKSILKNALPDRIEDAEDNVFLSSIERLLEWVTVDEITILLGLILAGLFVISLLNFIFHKSKPFTAGLGGFFIFLLILNSIIFYFKWLEVKDPRVVVLDKEVSARYGPSDKETKAFVLHEGAEARVTDETGDWYYILLKNKNIGWIPKKSCEIL